jgi:Ser/Thr protein kinase RdoA (MazF antagonist)
LERVADAAVIASVVEQAGEQLALINQLPVTGFGFVRRRGREWPLTAAEPCYAPFVVSFLPRPWPGPLAHSFAMRELDAIERLIEQEQCRPDVCAKLAHGDFDFSAVFCSDGEFSGIIDFGEARGAEATFDLGHFQLQDETHLSALMRGYLRVAALPGDYAAAIRCSALLLGLRQLARWLEPPRSRSVNHPAVTRRAQRIRALLSRDVVAEI